MGKVLYHKGIYPSPSLKPEPLIFHALPLRTGFLSSITALLLPSLLSSYGFGASRKCQPVQQRFLQGFGP